MKKIAVIFGGISSEYEVSLKSSVAIIEAMKEMDYEVVKIGITQKGKWYLVQGTTADILADTWFSKDKSEELGIDLETGHFYLKRTSEIIAVDVLFPVLHGGYGENGAMQGLFEMLNIPYVGCGVASSAISMNKIMLHQFAESIGVSSTPSLLVTEQTATDRLQPFIEKHGFPLYVKPNEAGSSKGITRVEKQSEMSQAIAEALQYDHKILVQKEVTGIEIGCAVMGNDELFVGECDQINLVEGFFDYEEKYNLITAEIILPAKISTEIKEDIQNQAKRLYQELGCKGLARIDFFLTNQGEIFLNEINTMPGFTSHSRFPMMMRAIGISYQDIIEHLIKLGEEAYNESIYHTN